MQSVPISSFKYYLVGLILGSVNIQGNKNKLTDIGESAPRFLSRKKDAESIDATASIIGLDCSDDEIFIGGSDDQTLPFIMKMPKLHFT